MGIPSYLAKLIRCVKVALKCCLTEDKGFGTPDAGWTKCLPGMRSFVSEILLCGSVFMVQFRISVPQNKLYTQNNSSLGASFSSFVISVWKVKKI